MKIQDLRKLIKEEIQNVLSEALNKDIKAFGQDLDEKFKEAGFDTLVLMRPPTSEQLNIVKTNPKAAIFEVFQTPEIQQLNVTVNPKMVSKAESIINKFQLSNYSGSVLKRGWTAKQVQGAFNPGDIVKQDSEKGRGIWYFYRLAKVDTKVKNNLNEATDFKSFTVLQPGEGWEEIKYGAGKSFLAFNVDKPEVTLVGSTPEEKNFFDEIAQMVGGQVEEGDKFGFELTIPVAKYEELFNVQ